MQTAQARQPRIAIIGGGFSGIIAAIAFRRAGLTDFVLYEREDDFGGTWHVNRYPGCAVDTPSEVYRLSYLPYRWSASHACGEEVLGYVKYAADKYDITPRIRCGVTVQRVAWDDERHVYDIVFGDGRTEQAHIVVSAVGLLSEPNIPRWPGMDGFRGKIVHTAKWDPALDHKGKRVAVVGTGSTAVQVVPEMAREAGHLLVFQRQPGWLLPKVVRDYGCVPGPVSSQEEIEKCNADRVLGFAEIEKVLADGRGSIIGSAENEQGRSEAEKFIRESFADRPDLIPLVTPTYPFLGKRPVFSNDFYPALKRDNVTLVPHAVERVTPTGVVDASGTEHAVDIIVLATGFKASEFLCSFAVEGVGGLNLHDYWAGEPRAYLGVMVPSFPNFFMMYGPNTNSTGGLVSMFEGEAEFAAGAVKRLMDLGGATVAVKETAFEQFNDWLVESFAHSTYKSTRNYFQSKSGRVVTNFPRGMAVFRQMLRDGLETALIFAEATKSKRDMSKATG
jgi:cation diffusion facilitator CzcD-associated flavoprotein CzcO